MSFKILPKFIAIIFYIFVPTRLTYALTNEDVDKFCEEIKRQGISIPKDHRPKLKDELELKGCRSDVLYYGIGREFDYIKARHCAFLELRNNEEYMFGGPSILMMIYSHGKKIEKNIKLA